MQKKSKNPQKETKFRLMKIFFTKNWPFLFIFVLWFLFSAPYFFSNVVPYPAEYQVNAFSPWGADVQQFGGPVKNKEMPDVITQIYPWKHFTIETLKKGQIPFWNPYSFSGNLHVANYQSAVFSPFTLLYFLFPFIDAWSITILLQPLFTMLFMYLFLRECGVSCEGSVIGSISFAFCGFITVWMAYGTLGMAISFLPLVLFGIEKSFKKSSLFHGLLITLGILFSLLSGHFQTSLYLICFSFAYLFIKSWVTKDRRFFYKTFFFFLLGILFAFPQIIPTMQSYQSSIRSSAFIGGGGIPWQYLITMFIPDFFGNPTTRNHWFGYYAEFASFFGTIPFLFLLVTIFRKKNHIARFFWFTGIFTLFLAIDSPLQVLIGALKIPVFSTSAPGRIIVLTSFSFSVLAAFGFDYMATIEKRTLKKVVASFVASLTCFWILLLALHILPQDKLAIAIRNSLFPMFLCCIFISFLITNVYLVHKIVKRCLVILVLLIIAFDSFRFAQKWVPFDPKDLVYPDMPIIHALQKVSKDGRVYGNLGNQIESYYGISSIEGYDPLYQQRYGEFIESAATGKFTQAQRSVVKLARDGKYTDRVLDLLNVQTIYNPVLDTGKIWAYPVWKNKSRYRKIYNDEHFELYKNTEAMKRVDIFYEYEIITDKKRIIENFYKDNFPFRDKLILEEDPKISSNGTKLQKSNARIVSYTPNVIQVVVSTEKQALLFLSDTYAANWHVYVNHHEQKLYRADYAFRAVVVPKGNSTVDFVYKEFF